MTPQAGSSFRRRLFISPQASFILLLSTLFLNQVPQVKLQSSVDESFYERPGVLGSEILQARGFLAEDKYFTTTDGYVIRMTRGRNPLINNGTGGLANRVPILFIHGILESDNVFLINSFDVRPRDLSHLSLVGNSEFDEQAAMIEEQLAREPAAKSLPLLALTLGHEIWIMSRRGFPGSQQLVGDPTSIPASEADRSQQAAAAEVLGLREFSSSLTDRQGYLGSGSILSGFFGSGGRTNFWGPFTSALSALFDYGAIAQQVPFSFDRKFWNFSFDEQARYDFPQAINFVCNQTGRAKISVVSHSAGGAIQLMALSLYPKLADKIESSILWSQGFSLGHGGAFDSLGPVLPFLEAYIGSVPPAFTTTEIQAIAGLFCASQLAQSTLCEGIADLLLGASGGQEPIRPEFINSLLYPTASHELAQNIQIVPYGQMRAYNYGPFYNLSAVRLETMSFYVGATDATVSPADVRATLPLLRVPYKFRMIDTTFNHNGYFYHNNNAQLAIIPSMRDIHQYSATAAAAAAAQT